jgi:L-Ala-D/L-Glu epimerase
MKITRVRVIPINIPFKSDYPDDSIGHDPTHSTVLVVLETDDGHIGLGEATPWSAMELGLTPKYLAELVSDFFGPVVLGQDPRDTSKLHELMDTRAYGSVGLEAAKSAIDCALYDLLGKAFGVPVVDLIGGRVRDGLPGMVGIGIDAPDVMAAKAKGLVELHAVKYVKVKIGGGRVHGTWPKRSDPDLDLERLQRMRSALPADVTIIADANQGFTPADAIRLINRADIEPCMFEQPVDANDVEGLERVARAVSARLVVDEAAYTPSRLVKILPRVPLAAVNIKPARAGGFFGALQMIRIVEAFGLRCTVDCILETRIGGTMIAHLAATVREDAFIATAATIVSDLWLDDQRYWSGGTSFRDGHYFVGREPGLGLELTPAFADLLAESTAAVAS